MTEPQVIGYRENQALVSLTSFMALREQVDQLTRTLTERGTCAARVFQPVNGGPTVELVLSCVLVNEHGGLHRSAGGDEWAEVDESTMTATLAKCLLDRGIRLIPGENVINLALKAIDELNEALVSWSQGESGLHNPGKPIVLQPTSSGVTIDPAEFETLRKRFSDPRPIMPLKLLPDVDTSVPFGYLRDVTGSEPVNTGEVTMDDRCPMCGFSWQWKDEELARDMNRAARCPDDFHLREFKYRAEQLAEKAVTNGQG